MSYVLSVFLSIVGVCKSFGATSVLSASMAVCTRVGPLSGYVPSATSGSMFVILSSSAIVAPSFPAVSVTSTVGFPASSSPTSVRTA